MATSAGSDPLALTRGQNLVLVLDDAHGVDAPHGTAAGDYLDLESRRALDQEALAALARWREAFDGPLTVDGVCLSFVAEWPLFALLLDRMRVAAALGAAIEALSPAGLSVAAGDAHRPVVEVVGAAAGVPVEVVAEAGREVAAFGSSGRGHSLRRRVVDTLLGRGAPTVLRRRGTLVLSYWPVVPLVERMLEERGERVTLALQKRLDRPATTVRAALQGGFVGRAGPKGIEQAAADAAGALDAAMAADPPALEVRGVDIGRAVHEALVESLQRDAGQHIATARVLRKAYASGKIKRVVATYDSVPFPRLVASLAREAGIPVLVVAHGAYVMPQTVADLDVGDEVAVFTDAVAPENLRRDRPVHEIGYPVPTEIAPDRSAGVPDAPTIVVLGQNGHPYTALFDDRVVVCHYVAALEAIAAAVPGAKVVLRPHPSQGLAPAQRAIERVPGIDATIDPDTSIVDLMAGADLCIGALTAAATQAALPATPVIVLNVTGFDWQYPLGQGTDVPVATSGDELAPLLGSWAAGEPVPGRQTLISALGADRTDSVDRLLGIVKSLGR